MKQSLLALLALPILLIPCPSIADGDDATRTPGLVVETGTSGTLLRLEGQEPFHRTSDAVSGERLVEVPGSDTLLALWTETGGNGRAVPFYAVGRGGEMGEGKATSYILKIGHGEFDPETSEPRVAPTLSADETASLYIVQFSTQPLEEFRDSIRGHGGAVYGFLANHAHIVRMGAEAREKVSALPFVRWVGPYHPAYRLEQYLLDGRAEASKLSPSLRCSILLFDTGGDAKSAVARRIEAIGGVVDRADAGKHLMEATLTPDQLFRVAGWDEVQYIDRWSPLEKDMDIVREIGGADYLETVAGYTGQGVRAEIFDDGFNTSHPDFASRPLLVHGGAVSTNSHGTATCGINFGDGTGDPRARGLMPDGQGIVADYDNVGLTGSNRYTHTGELLEAPYYAVFQTASVGSSRTTQYSTISADHDTMLFDWDIVHCQSQSNAGNQDSRPQAWAKNVVSGGAFNHYDTLTRTDDCWCNTGSIGPASDGRIKPDLSFFYDDTYTTYSTGDGYGEFGGTSGATPSICGHFGLFFQMWSDGIFGNETIPGGTVFENRPHMTTAKAFMINTAEQHPFTGTTHDLTRVHQGWGVPSVQNLYDLRDNISFIDESVVLANMETAEYIAIVDPGEPAMRITMTYADPAGNPASSQHRINDLTLRVTSPSSVVYWGNNGLLEGNWSVAGGSADTIDTVENVFIESPEEGVWTVEVIASEINQDGHVETPETDADFALVVSGAYLQTCTSDGRISLGGAKFACEDEATIRVVDCDLNLDDNIVETVTVTIDSGSEPAGESVLLTETAPASAKFQATIPLSGTDAPGVLLVAEGDTVTATYIDADDGAGGTDVVKTDQATVDCTPPVISNVQTVDIDARSARVTFDTDEPARGTVRYGLDCGDLSQSSDGNSFVTSHSIGLTGLDDNTTYFYAVDAVDEVGNASTDDNGGACHSFTTPETPDFYTEQFGSDNDTDFLMISFTPDGSNDFYSGCVDPIGAFPSDPAGGTTLSLSDDSSAAVDLTGGATVSLYGVSYGTLYVGSNGYITFGIGDSDYTETLAEHFDTPRISAVYDDLNPASAGTVSWKQWSDRVVVTWDAVAEYGTSNSNSFQIEMFWNGTIRINYLEIAVADGIAGISEGEGLYPEFFETDLSAMASCGGGTCFNGILDEDEDRIDCGGPCPACQCLSDGECLDDLFCNGTETCDAYGNCAAGSDPCPGEACKEEVDACVECIADTDCDDGLYCNGSETCRGNDTCLAGFDPCPWGTCDEGTDSCLTCDNDGICEPGEDCHNCAGDCISGSYPVCGNTICEVADGEDCVNCPEDCNNLTTGKPDFRYCCGDGIVGENPVTCADSRCNAGGNTCADAPVLAYCCGDATCNDIESMANCEADCTPDVPGEAGAGAYLRVTGYDSVTGLMSISFGVPCAASGHTIEYGELTRTNLETYNWTGQECGLDGGGAYDWDTGGAPDSIFFVVVANNGSQEGSYGVTGIGAERPEDTASAVCPMEQNLQYRCD